MSKKRNKIAQIYYDEPQSAGISVQSPQSVSTPRKLTLIIGLFWCFARCCCGCGKGGKKKSGDAFTQSWFFMIFIILYYSIIHVPKTHVLVQMAQQLKQTLDHNECCSAPSPLSVPASNLCERHTFVKHKKEQ